MEQDMKDGVILINLLEILTGKSIDRYYKAPKSRTYMIANHTIALAFMGQQKLGANCSAQGMPLSKVSPITGFISLCNVYHTKEKERREVGEEGEK